MAVPEDVGADLGQGALEQDEAQVVDRASGLLAEQVDRAVKGVQPLLEAVERGVEFEGLPGGGRLRNR